MIIQHNIPSLNSLRNTKQNSSNVAKNLEKLSSGFKINKAADDAAGLAISEKMRAQIRGINRGTLNANDGVSLVNTGEGGLNEVHEILQRMHELASQSSNGIYDDTPDREALDAEYQTLLDEINRITVSTNYNGIPLLCVSPSEEQVPIIETVTQTRQEPVYMTTVVPTDDAIMNKIQASVTDPPVDSEGKFQFFAKNNNGDVSQLLFGGSNPTTSHPSIQINGKAYDLWGSPSISRQATEHNNGVWSTEFELKDGALDLTITQTVSIADNPHDIGGQSYKIDYVVVNNTASNVTLNMMYHVDTQLGANDHAPFSVGGQVVTNNTSYPRDGNIPGRISIFDSVDSPYIHGVISVNGSSGHAFTAGSEPNKVNLARYTLAYTYGDLSAGTVGDSGYSILWENRTAASDGTPVVMTTYYGVNNPPPEILAGMGPTVEVQTLIGYRDVTESREEIVGYRSELVNPRVWIQSGASSGEGMYVDLCDCRPRSLGISKTAIDPYEAAKEALALVKGAINHVSVHRANFGASQNRLESMTRANDLTGENLQSSESLLRDLDMAKEMMELTKNSVLSQSSQAMLAQANQTPQGVLNLLR